MRLLKNFILFVVLGVFVCCSGTSNQNEPNSNASELNQTGTFNGYSPMMSSVAERTQSNQAVNRY